MTADVPTLMLMIVVSSVAMAAALLVLGWGNWRDGLHYWAGSLLVAAVGYVLFLLRGQIPDVWSVVWGNTLMSVMFAGLLAAVRNFQGQPMQWPVMLVPPLLVAALMQHFIGNFGLRVACSAYLLACQALWVLWMLHTRRQSSPGRGAWLLAAGLAVEAAMLLARGSSALASAMEGSSILHGNTVQTLTFMVAFIALLVTSMGCVFMAKDRADETNRRLAGQDALTGVANRRSIIAALERAVASALRQRQFMALMMVDIDHFKHVNDRYGHLAGDQVLRHVVALIQQRIRAQDMVGRYGGEEFLVVLPDTTLQGARALAQQLCDVVQATPCAWEGGHIPVTLSIGVYGGVLAPQDAWDLLIHAADSALYCAKAAGRNRVELAQATGPLHRPGSAPPDICPAPLT